MKGEVLWMSLFMILVILHVIVITRAIVIVRIDYVGLGMRLGLLFLSIQHFLLTSPSSSNDYLLLVYKYHM